MHGLCIRLHVQTLPMDLSSCTPHYKKMNSYAAQRQSTIKNNDNAFSPHVFIHNECVLIWVCVCVNVIKYRNTLFSIWSLQSQRIYCHRSYRLLRKRKWWKGEVDACTVLLHDTLSYGFFWNNVCLLQLFSNFQCTVISKEVIELHVIILIVIFWVIGFGG